MSAAQKQWFYGIDGEQNGPVNPAHFAELIARGSVDGSTLVWTDGMSGWLPANDTELQPLLVQDRSVSNSASSQPTDRFAHDRENEAAARSYVESKYRRLIKKHSISHVLEAYHVYRFVQRQYPSAAFAKKRESWFLKKVIDNMKKSLERAKKYGLNIDVTTAYERYKNLVPSMQDSTEPPAIRFITAAQETRENRIETAKNVAYGLVFGGMLLVKALYVNR